MKLLFILMVALMLPVVPALACFPQAQEEEVLFASEGRNFDRNPLPMSFCELPEPGFVVIKGKCYDFDAITDFDTEEECQADEICKAYREQQQKQYDEDGTYHMDCSKAYRPMIGCGDDIVGTTPMPPSAEPSPPEECSHEGLGPDVCRPIQDPNHGEIKGDEELEEEQDEEEHQEEEEQGQETTEETTGETDE